MFVDCRINPETLLKPRSFAGLMTLYESNYIRLVNLVPQLADVRGTLESAAADDVPLRLSVVERTPYTATLSLNYVFRAGDVEQLEPDMQIRVYFDGRLAEALCVSDVHIDRLLRGQTDGLRDELDSRWARNVMLNKWLEYCADREHCFTR